MKIGDTFFLRPASSANKETQSKIQECGKCGFSLEKMPEVPWFADSMPDNTRKWILVKSLEFPAMAVWLPVEEIEILG